MANEKLSKELILKVYNVAAAAYVTVARTTSWNMEVNKETVEVTSFDSSGWREFLVDLKGFTMSADGIILRTTTAGFRNYEQLLTDLIDSDSTIIMQLVDPAMYTSATDGTSFAHEVGAIYLTSLPISGSLGDKQTYSMTAQGTGKLTLVRAKYDTPVEAKAAADDASFDLGDFNEGSSDEILLGDVVFVEDNVSGSVNGYYSRSVDQTPSTFADAWTVFSI